MITLLFPLLLVMHRYPLRSNTRFTALYFSASAIVSVDHAIDTCSLDFLNSSCLMTFSTSAERLAPWPDHIISSNFASKVINVNLHFCTKTRFSTAVAQILPPCEYSNLGTFEPHFYPSAPFSSLPILSTLVFLLPQSNQSVFRKALNRLFLAFPTSLTFKNLHLESDNSPSLYLHLNSLSMIGKNHGSGKIDSTYCLLIGRVN